MKPAPRLWVVSVKLIGPNDARAVHAVIDTGANTSLMPPEILRAIGCDPALSKERIGILTASGSESGVVVRVPEIIALDHRVRDLEILSHALPGGRIDGVLGMDFLLHIPDFQVLDKRFQEFFV